MCQPAAGGVNGITTADCTQVGEAVAATEMDQNPANAPTNTAPTATRPGPVHRPFSDNLENPASGNWTTAAITGPNAGSTRRTRTRSGFDATYATSGTTNFWGFDQPVDGTTRDRDGQPGHRARRVAFLRFNHAYGFEDDSLGTYDGGVVEYSTDGGATWIDAGPLFDSGGYNGHDLGRLRRNPLAGRAAFVAESNGFGSSRANLARSRARASSSASGSAPTRPLDDYGWFIDDISIYACEARCRTRGSTR